MIWGFATLLCVIIQAFFSMQEMAIISVNRLEVIYFALQGQRRARYIEYLLKHPHALFTTTLLMVNIALQVGSECSRRFYASMDLSSNWAPLSQVLIVVVMAELAPMLAARFWPRPVSFFGSPIIYWSSYLLMPISNWVDNLFQWMKSFTKQDREEFERGYREELRHIFDQSDIDRQVKRGNLAQEVSDKLLKCRSLSAGELARPISTHQILASKMRVKEARKIFISHPQLEYLLIYDENPYVITGVILARMLVSKEDDVTLKTLGQSPFYMGSSQTMFQWLAPLRTSRCPIAVVLDKVGKAIGVFHFDDMAEFLFTSQPKEKNLPVIECLFSANISLKTLEQDYGLTLYHLPTRLELTVSKLSKMTLSHWLKMQIERPLRQGDIFRFSGIEFRIEKMGWFNPLKITICTSAWGNPN